ncbi:MAG: ATP-binding protein [Tepidisphaeraceae bacterium]
MPHPDPNPPPIDAPRVQRLGRQVSRYALALLILLVAHTFARMTWHTLGVANATVFLAAVVLASLNGGYGPGLLVTALATVDLAYVFMPPYHSFLLSFEDLLFIVVFATLAVVTSSLQAHRRAAEDSLREAHAKLERDLVHMSEREQRSIGHDLHDGLGQELTGIAMLTAALASHLEKSDPAESAEAQRLVDLVQESIQHTRELARGLSPVDLEGQELVAALRRLAERVSRLPGINCRLNIASAPQLDAATGIHVYRIAQEAITNAIRHGKAHEIVLTLDAKPGRLQMTIADDGTSIPPHPRTTGMGLQLMKSRAKMMDGSVEIRPGAAGGTVVVLRVDRVR